MANRNRLSGGYQNRRNDSFGDYNRGFTRDSYGGGAPRGPQFGGVNPWQGPAAPAVQASTETTIALASNLINNLLQSRNSVPSLLDINVRRDFGGYGQGYQADRRIGMTRMGGRSMSQGGGGLNRRPVQVRHNAGSPRRPPRQETSKGKPPVKQVKKEDQANAESETAAEGDAKRGDGEAAAEDGDKKEVKTSYDGINPIFLVCHICEKKMWDGRSFDNHIKGRAHFIMMEKIRESYKMTADAMRQEQRISEMRKDRRGFQQQRKVFCAMCDLYVVAEGSHRRSAGHQKLKRYLHPACNTCRQEMPTRIEFEEHRLTPQHMKILQDKHKDQEPEIKTEVMQMSTLQDELALVRPLRNRQRKGQQAKEGETPAEEAAVKTEEGGEQAETEVKEGESAEKPEGVKMEEDAPVDDGPVMILDYQEGDDLSEMTRDNLPKYQPDRQLGASFIQDYTCKQCTLCRRLFDSEETAEVHTRTYKHFQSFLRLMHSKGNFKTKQDAVKREVPQEEGAEGADGSWKRRKLDNAEGGAAEGEADYQNGEGEETNVEDAEMNGEDTLNTSQDVLNEEIDQVLQGADDTAQIESEPVEELQEESQVPEPEPVVESPKPVAQQKTPVQQQQQPANRGGRGRGRGRGRGSGRNRI